MSGNRTIIVIGAGPAGMMAAGQAALTGADVLLLEKKDRAGRKLRITGKGRCNITNVASIREFIAHFGPGGKFLRNGFSRFFSTELLDFLKERGIDTVTERGGRVFPQSQEAGEIVDGLTQWLTRCGVKLQTNTSVKRLVLRENTVTGVDATFTTSRGPVHQRHDAEAVIVATGGASYPGTGSTGDGYTLARQAGHAVAPILPALVPLVTRGDEAKRLQGLSLKNVQATLWADGKKSAQEFGELLFAHFGLTGPVILSLSGRAARHLEAGQKVEIALDLKPALDEQKLDQRLLRDFNDHGKKSFQNILKGLLPQKMIPVCMDLTDIDANKPGHQISAAERQNLRKWLKDFRFIVENTRPLKEAIVTAGGVDLKEIDPRTMASRKVAGLYWAGEVMDLDADTGGYNLQAAFTTGWLAGFHAATEIKG